MGRWKRVGGKLVRNKSDSSYKSGGSSSGSSSDGSFSSGGFTFDKSGSVIGVSDKAAAEKTLSAIRASGGSTSSQAAALEAAAAGKTVAQISAEREAVKAKEAAEKKAEEAKKIEEANKQRLISEALAKAERERKQNYNQGTKEDVGNFNFNVPFYTSETIVKRNTGEVARDEQGKIIRQSGGRTIPITETVVIDPYGEDLGGGAYRSTERPATKEEIKLIEDKDFKVISTEPVTKFDLTKQNIKDTLVGGGEKIIDTSLEVFDIYKGAEEFVSEKVTKPISRKVRDIYADDNLTVVEGIRKDYGDIAAIARERGYEKTAKTTEFIGGIGAGLGSGFEESPILQAGIFGAGAGAGSIVKVIAPKLSPGFKIGGLVAGAGLTTASLGYTGYNIISEKDFTKKGELVGKTTKDFLLFGAGFKTTFSQNLKPELKKLVKQEDIGTSYIIKKGDEYYLITSSTKQTNKLFSQSSTAYKLSMRDGRIFVSEGKGSTSLINLKTNELIGTKNFDFGGNLEKLGNAKLIKNLKVLDVIDPKTGKILKITNIKDLNKFETVGGRINLDLGNKFIKKDIIALVRAEDKNVLSLVDDLTKGYIQKTGEKGFLRDINPEINKLDLLTYDKYSNIKVKFNPKQVNLGTEISIEQLGLKLGYGKGDLSILTSNKGSTAIKKINLKNIDSNLKNIAGGGKLPSGSNSGGNILTFKTQNLKETFAPINIGTTITDTALSNIALPTSRGYSFVIPKVTLTENNMDTINSMNKPITSTQTITLDKVDQINKQTNISRTKSSSASKRTTITESAIESIQETGTLKLQANLQGNQNVNAKALKLKSGGLGFGLGVPIIKEIPETIPPSLIIPKSSYTSPKKGLFGVQVRRFGEFRNVGTFRTQKEAIAAGKRVTGGTLAATFRLTGTGKAPKSIKGFKTKETKAGTEYIELPKFRLSKLGEVSEIKTFKKRRTKKKR